MMTHPAPIFVSPQVHKTISDVLNTAGPHLAPMVVPHAQGMRKDYRSQVAPSQTYDPSGSDGPSFFDYFSLLLFGVFLFMFSSIFCVFCLLVFVFCFLLFVLLCCFDFLLLFSLFVFCCFFVLYVYCHVFFCFCLFVVFLFFCWLFFACCLFLLFSFMCSEYFCFFVVFCLFARLVFCYVVGVFFPLLLWYRKPSQMYWARWGQAVLSTFDMALWTGATRSKNTCIYICIYI